MLTASGRRQGVRVVFDQYYSWNGERLEGGFLVGRDIAYRGATMETASIEVFKQPL